MWRGGENHNPNGPDQEFDGLQGFLSNFCSPYFSSILRDLKVSKASPLGLDRDFGTPQNLQQGYLFYYGTEAQSPEPVILEQKPETLI